MAKTSNKTICQYVGVPLKGFIELNATIYATNDLTDSLKFLLIQAVIWLALNRFHSYVGSTT